MTHVRFREPISGYDVTVPCYQWGQTEGKEYLERMLGTTPHGVVYREKFRDEFSVPYTQRLMQVLFEQTDDTIHRLRTLSWFAMKNAGQVLFYPDADDAATYWWVNWQTTVEVERVIDNHLTIELTIIEAARGFIVPTPPPVASLAQSLFEVVFQGEQAHLTQAVIEVFIHMDAGNIAQAAIEAMTRSPGAYVTQSVIETQIRPPNTYLTQSVIEVLIDET